MEAFLGLLSLVAMKQKRLVSLKGLFRKSNCMYYANSGQEAIEYSTTP